MAHLSVDDTLASWAAANSILNRVNGAIVRVAALTDSADLTESEAAIASIAWDALRRLDLVVQKRLEREIVAAAGCRTMTTAPNGTDP